MRYYQGAGDRGRAPLLYREPGTKKCEEPKTKTATTAIKFLWIAYLDNGPSQP